MTASYPQRSATLRALSAAVLLCCSPLAAAKTEDVARIGQVPLYFEPNRGQTDSSVDFLARTPDSRVYLKSSEAIMALDDQVLQFEFLGARDVPAQPQDPRKGKVHYLRGARREAWLTDLPTFGRVHYAQVYEGIDLVYYGNPNQLEYDFVVAPGIDPNQIALRIRGASRMRITENGDLLLRLRDREVVQHRPIAYQLQAGKRIAVAAGYRIHQDGHDGTSSVSFALGAYDRSKALTIDPVVSFSTYLGGSSADGATGLAVDADGATYLTGYTESADFPTAAPYQPSGESDVDGFVVKLEPDGSDLVYATYMGGSDMDFFRAIAVGSDGSAYLAGETQSGDFPLLNPIQNTLTGAGVEAFIAKLGPTGNALVYSTYLGGDNNDSANAVAVDPEGRAYVAGYTQSADFPTVAAYQDSIRNGDTSAFLSKLAADGQSLVYSTFLRGADYDAAAYGVATGADGSAYVAGFTEGPGFPLQGPADDSADIIGEGFVSKFSTDGDLVYSTYIGGDEGEERARAVAVDSSGAVYVAGETDSEDFPVVGGLGVERATPSVDGSDTDLSDDAFVVKINAAGNQFVYATYLADPGSTTTPGGRESVYALDVDSAGRAYVAGSTFSRTDIAGESFPSVNAPSGMVTTTDPNAQSAFVSVVSADASEVLFSALFGGDGADVFSGLAVGAGEAIHVGGFSQSSDFPTASALDGSQGGAVDAIVVKVTQPFGDDEGSGDDDGGGEGGGDDGGGGGSCGVGLMMLPAALAALLRRLLCGPGAGVTEESNR